jgi:uncharacterized protein
MKYLLWIVLVFVVLFGLRLLNVAKAKQRADDASGASPRTPPAEATVKCARCGVYLPRSDAVPSPAGPVCGAPGCTQQR